MNLPDQLRAAIKKSGLTQEQLAAKSGVRQGRISDFLNGKDIRLATAGKLAQAIGLRLSRTS